MGRCLSKRISSVGVSFASTDSSASLSELPWCLALSDWPQKKHPKRSWKSFTLPWKTQGRELLSGSFCNGHWSTLRRKLLEHFIAHERVLQDYEFGGWYPLGASWCSRFSDMARSINR